MLNLLSYCKDLMVLLAFLLLLVNCSDQASYDEREIVRDVTIMLSEYHKAIEQGGLEAEFDYLDQSGEFFWVPPGFESALDYDSVATILRQNDPGISRMSITWDTLVVMPLRSDLAQFYGVITSSTTDTNNHTSEVKLVESGLVIKRVDGWKLLNGQSAAFPK